MPEYDGIKITRAEELARHAYRRELVRAVRAAAKGSGWRCADGAIFRDLKGWFVSVYPLVVIFWRETRATLQLKPMGIDPIFWDIMNMPENQNSTLSFRAQGAWTCRTPYYAESPIEESDMDAALVAKRVLAWADDQVSRLNASMNLESYATFIRERPDFQERGRYLAALVTTLVLMDRFEEAEQACLEAEGRGQFPEFLTAEGTFVEVALPWLRSKSVERRLN